MAFKHSAQAAAPVPVTRHPVVWTPEEGRNNNNQGVDVLFNPLRPTMNTRIPWIGRSQASRSIGGALKLLRPYQ
ncbi:MAG: hypothetical protein ACYCZF_07880 [Anaerolineae bacterium]